MLPSVLSVTTPAIDLTLLTLAELRSAVNLTNNSRDSDLKILGADVADAITQACKVATDGATPATFRLETLTETFRLNRWFNRKSQQSSHAALLLGRRPIVSVVSIVEAGITLDPSAYEVHAGAGMLERLVLDAPSHWARDKIVVSYTAGWSTVPQGLKRAAGKLAKLYWDEKSKNSSLRQITIPGVSEKTYWIGSPTDPDIPQDVMDDLGPYINLQA